MTDTRSQSTYQVRLGWGETGLTTLETSGIVVIVDALGSSGDLATQALQLPHSPTVFVGTLRNRAVTAKAIYDEQVARGGRTAINLVLAGHEGAFAVEDYLVAGAIADSLTALGIDHSSPDVAVATEGFRPLTRAVKHLFSASAAGLELKELGRGDEVKAAAEIDAESDAIRL